MGTQEERDWVDAANDLLSKCHINLRLKKLTDCDAGVFVALYEAILGDKVPDYIAAPRSQEDDAHNVQSVIDSLALDYLQISLSHITGENVVRGDKESVRNLLEIFDGLLEYLTEQTSEEDSQTSDEPDCVSDEAPSPAQEPPLERLADEREALSEFRPPSSRGSTAQSSQYSGPLWDMEGSESTAELIRLGDSARTFTAKSQAGRNGSPPCTEPPNGIHRTGNSCTGTGASHHRDHAVEPVSLPAAPVSLYVPHGPATQLREPLRPATLLQPPYQPAQPPTEGLADVLMDRSLPASASGQRGEEVPVPRTGSPSPRQLSDTPALNGLRSPRHSPVESEKSESSSSTSASRKKKTSTSTELELPESGATGSKRVAFRTQPDIRLLTLQSEQEGLADWGSGEEEEEEEEAGSGQQGRARQQNLRGPGDQTSLSEGKLSGASPGEEPLSWRRLKNRQKEQELQEMSDKLSRRLEELHVMLQQALGEGAETSETREEDKLSHHSDSFMECRRTKRQTGMDPRYRSPLLPQTGAHSAGSRSPR
ncbi:CEP95 protein, partial [Amia calva]|nr:CEP95 protein [Amia calva]